MAVKRHCHISMVGVEKQLSIHLIVSAVQLDCYDVK